MIPINGSLIKCFIPAQRELVHNSQINSHPVAFSPRCGKTGTRWPPQRQGPHQPGCSPRGAVLNRRLESAPRSTQSGGGKEFQLKTSCKTSPTAQFLTQKDRGITVKLRIRSDRTYFLFQKHTDDKQEGTKQTTYFSCSYHHELHLRAHHRTGQRESSRVC